MSKMQQQQEESARQAGSAMMRKAAAAHITHISHQLHCCALLMWWAMWTSTVLRNHLCFVIFKQWDNRDSESPTSVACCTAAPWLGLCLQPAAWESCVVHVVQRWAESCAIRASDHVFGWLSRMCWLWRVYVWFEVISLSMITAVLRSKERSWHNLIGPFALVKNVNCNTRK